MFNLDDPRVRKGLLLFSVVALWGLTRYGRRRLDESALEIDFAFGESGAMPSVDTSETETSLSEKTVIITADHPIPASP
jgi:hypothetical protein